MGGTAGGCTQKSPTHTQNSPVDIYTSINMYVYILMCIYTYIRTNPKRALYTLKRALYTLKRALYTLKRDLHTLNRAL